MNPIFRAVIAEDHALVRSGFRRILESVESVRVVAEAANGREALEAVEEHGPELLILDLTMPDMNGIEVLRRIRELVRRPRALVVSMHTDRLYVLRAFKEGAHGYLVKAAGEEQLRTAVRSVLAGRRYVSPEVAGHVTEGPGEPEIGEGEPGELLTARQREVLQLIAEGNSTSEIADKLYVSVKTVETHRANIQERLGIRDVAGLVRYAIRTGMVSSGP